MHMCLMIVMFGQVLSGCKRLACEEDKAIAELTLKCQEHNTIRVIRVKNIAERTCKGVKICEVQIQYPRNLKSKCDYRTECPFEKVTEEDGHYRQCKTYDEDGHIIWHKTTSQEVCYSCNPLPTTEIPTGSTSYNPRKIEETTDCARYDNTINILLYMCVSGIVFLLGGFMIMCRRFRKRIRQIEMDHAESH
ncbi:unnamed protein product [Owenia fusiformis]|uniref:Uncharacterized protein n=1 Tax=Owenia fusiformis TaxID=6347 RepID=A0A8S4N7E6_OWEFU|nr:unnamed protein product [Owenia fusiformis]